jgi:hypothetical protein
MAGCEVKRVESMRGPVMRFVLLLAAFGVAVSTSASGTDVSDIDASTPRRTEAPIASPPSDSAPPAVAVKPQGAPVVASEGAAGANPLWAIPLATLSQTRDRPIFSSSRRPPPPAVVPVPQVKAPPPPLKSPPAERPQLSLVGTVAGSEQSFGIFLDQASKTALRLKVGEAFQGWKLRSVQGREATFERDQQITILSLAQPDAGADAHVPVQAKTELRQGLLDFQPQRAGVR